MSILIKGSNNSTVTTIETNTSTINSNVVGLVTKLVGYLDFWSDVDDVITIANAPADYAFPDVVISGLPSSISITRVVAIIKIRAIENTNADNANAINGGQHIQVRKSGGTWQNAIDLADNQWTIAAATREAGDILIGDRDIKTTVDEDATYNVQLADGQSDQLSLQLNDVIVGLRVYFTIS